MDSSSEPALASLTAQVQTAMKEVVDGKLMAVVVVLFFLAFLHGIFPGLGPRKGPAPLPTLDLSSVMESLKAELPGVLQAVLPSMLDEALARGDALPQDGANLVVQAFREELPQALQKLLPELLPELLVEAKKGTTTDDGDGGAPGPSLTQEMLKNTMDQCLDEKWMTTRQGQQEDFDKVVQIASTAQLKKYLDKHKEVQPSVEALAKQVETLTQLHTQAGKTEQVRFQTLDGAVRSRIEVVETNIKSRIDLLSSDMVGKFQAAETTQARLDVYVAKFEGLVEKLEAVPGRFTTATDRMEGLIRERTTSVQGDLNKMAGEVSHANREHTGLVRRLTASTDSLQAAVANMGAAMSQPPVDSRGTTESLDLLKDMAAQVATLAETMDEVVKELQNRPLPSPQPKAPPREHPAAGSAQTFAAPQEAAMTTGQPGYPQNMPTVIDLASRIPQQRLGNTPLATCMLSNGRKILVPEDEVLGPQQGPFASLR